MIVGCYQVDLYCDNSDYNTSPDGEGKRHDCRRPKFNAFPQQYSGETEFECLRMAREDGWSFTRNRPRFAYCPECNKKAKQ